MNRTHLVVTRIVFFLLAPALTGNFITEASPDFVKTPIILEAKDVLPAKLLRGDNYVVENRVENDGLINTYQLSTDYGPLKVESTEGLIIRIAELKAISANDFHSCIQRDRVTAFGKYAQGVEVKFVNLRQRRH